MFRELHNLHHDLVPEQFHHPKKKLLPVSSHSREAYVPVVPVSGMWKQARGQELAQSCQLLERQR